MIVSIVGGLAGLGQQEGHALACVGAGSSICFCVSHRVYTAPSMHFCKTGKDNDSKTLLRLRVMCRLHLLTEVRLQVATKPQAVKHDPSSLEEYICHLVGQLTNLRSVLVSSVRFSRGSQPAFAIAPPHTCITERALGCPRSCLEDSSESMCICVCVTDFWSG